MGTIKSLLRVSFICTVGLFSLSAYGQQTVRDSLHARLGAEKDPRRRIDLLNSLSFHYFDRDDSLAMSFAKEALTGSERLSYKKGLKYANLLVGIGYYAEGKFDRAIGQFQKAVRVETDSSEYYDLYSIALTGECQTVVARYDSAEQTFKTGLALAKKSGSFWLPRMYHGFARVYIKRWDNQKALLYLDSAKALLNENNYDFRAIELFSNYGEVYKNLVDRKKSLESFEKMCQLAESVGDRYHLIKCAVNQADYYFEEANYVQALKHAQSALEQSKLYSYPHQQILLYLKIGEIYMEMSEYDLALNYYLQSLSISEPLALPFETAQLNRRIAWVYKEEGKYDLSVQFANKALEISGSIKDQFGQASAHNIRGLAYMLQGKHDLSIAEHNQALALRTKINDVLGVVASMYNLGLVYEEQNLLEKALAQQMKVLGVAAPISNTKGLTLSYQRVARILIKLNRFDEAEEYLQNALEISSKTPTRHLRRNNYILYSQLFEARGDFPSALEYRKKYEAVNDSIFSETSASRIAEFQASYELEKKENEIAVLRAQRQLQENQLQLQNTEILSQRKQIYAAGAFVVIISVLVLVLFRLNRKLNETQKNLAEVNTQLNQANVAITDVNKNLEEKVAERTSQLRKAYVELDTFFYRSSHDFRRPLTTLIGLADVARITVKDRQAVDLFDLVKTTAHNLDKMLHKLQSISDLGAMELSYKNVMLKELIDSSLAKHMDEIEALGVNIVQDIRVTQPITSYPVLISIVLDNLLENAINFSRHSDPYINITAFARQGSVVIEIEDNGHGIPEKYRKNIFDMYFKGSDKSKGNGLGLYIVSKAIEKLSGTIEVETTYDKGSKFVVEIPDCHS